MEIENKPQSFGIPMAIVLAGVIIAGAVMYSNNQKSGSNLSPDVAPWTEEITNTGKHLLGSPTASVIITDMDPIRLQDNLNRCNRVHCSHDKIILNKN